MGIDAEELILHPFHEVVERGKEAVATAEGAADQDAELSQVMGKAGAAVVREGERALRRLRPLWDSQVGKYGDVFKESMGQNAAVEKRRRRLEDLLYDFEDYAGADTFVHERFNELQAATKALAMDVIDVMKKLRLDAAATPPYSPPSPSKFPPLPPLPALPPLPLKSPSRMVNGARSSSRPPTPPGRKGSRTGPPPDLSETTLPAPRTRPPPGKRDTAVPNTGGSQRSLKSNSTVHSRASSAFSVGSLPPPAYTPDSEAPPVPQITTHYNNNNNTADRPESRASSSSPGTHGPPTPQNSILSSQPSLLLSATDASSIASEIPDFPVPQPKTTTAAGEGDQEGSPPPTTPRYHGGGGGHRPPSRYEPHSLQAIQSLQQPAIPEGQAVAVAAAGGGGGSSNTGIPPRARAGHSFINFDSALTPIISELSRLGGSGGGSGSSPETSSSRSRSTTTTLSHATSMSSLPQAGGSSTTHAARPGTSIGIRTPATPADTPPKGPASFPLLPALPPAALEPQPPPASSAAHPALREIHPALRDDWAAANRTGLPPSSSTTTTPQQPREPDTSIGPRSSLHLLRGICPSAREFRLSAHADGVRRVAGHVAGHSAEAARCASCAYGHAWAELDLDVAQRMPRATFPREGGLLFRIRLLYKSHLGAPRPSEALYACLFCAQAGRVVREGDATVFRGADDLLRHVAAHPRPLPDVPGLTVLYGREVLATDPRVNDFDVWLTEPPRRGGVPAQVEAEVSRLPVATAVRGHVQRYGEKKLPRPDGKGSDAVLQFFEGARIVGVEFPARYGGKWCTGWHDGAWGYFPAKMVELERPVPGRLDAPPLLHGVGGTGVTAVAKFKWDPPGSAAKEGWLGFDKGDRLSNIGWPAGAGKEAWCWSGSTSRGRFGVFPRSHIDESSVREDASSQAPGGGGGMFKRKEGGGRLFGVRRRHSLTSTLSGSGVIELV